MALTEETEIDKIEFVGPQRHMHIRTATVIKRDGVEISRSFHRKVLQPDADMGPENAELKRIAAAVWTAEIKAAHAARVEEDRARRAGERAREQIIVQ